MRKAWSIVVGLILAGPAFAERCATLADDEARLACYDRVAGCLTTHDPTERLACYDAARPPPADVGTAPAEPSDADRASVARQQRSADEICPVPGAADGEERAANAVTAEVVAVQVDPRGLHYLTLDNGQVWRELSKSRLRFQPGDRVELSRGVLGSVNLRVDGRSGYIKVRRVE